MRYQIDALKKWKEIGVNCILWWAIGVGVGLLFAIAIGSEMQQSLATHLENSVSYLLTGDSLPFTYFLRRCLTYAQLILLVWGLEYLNYGFLGVRILLLYRGFLYGFTQLTWLKAYHLKGIWLALVAYWPHNLLFLLFCAYLEWRLHMRGVRPLQSKRQIGIILSSAALILAVTEAYGATAMFRYFFA